MNLNFEVVVYLLTYARRQAKHNESLVERQTIKAGAQPALHFGGGQFS